MPSRSSGVVVASCFSSERSFQTILLVVAVIVVGFPDANSGTFTVTNSCVAQTQAATQESEPDLKKAMKYHSALLRRPTPGYLYDRFYNTWLDTSSLDDLKAFLVDRANAPKAEAADQFITRVFLRQARQGCGGVAAIPRRPRKQSR